MLGPAVVGTFDGLPGGPAWLVLGMPRPEGLAVMGRALGDPAFVVVWSSAMVGLIKEALPPLGPASVGPAFELSGGTVVDWATL